MSPAVGKFHTNSSRGTKTDKDGNALSLFASKDQLGLKSSIATVEAPQDDQVPGTKAKISSRDQHSPLTVGTAKEQTTEGFVTVTKGNEKDINFLKHH